MSVEGIDLQQVRKAINRGDKATGRRLLEQLLESNLHGEAAWLWMSTIVDDPEQEGACLKKVLEINPNSERAQRRWFELQGILSPAVRKSTMPVSAQQASKPKQPERRKWKLLIAALVAAALIVVCLIIAYLFFA
jgi:ferric-dicitrate binding protein FerR (iron transport regulator)